MDQQASAPQKEVVPEMIPIKQTLTSDTEHRKSLIYTVGNAVQTIEKDGFRVFVDYEGKVLTDMVLLAKLRKLRLEIARKNELPAFRVLQNDVLVRLATDMPVSREEFVAIKGLGDRKYEQYGDEFIQAIREYLK